MKKMKKVSAVQMLAFMAVFAAGPSPVHGGIDSLRCGNDVVQAGDTELTLVRACGEPTMKRSQTVAHRTGKKEKKVLHREVHKWYYNKGRNDFVYVITLDGGKIMSIETGERGY